MAFNIDPKLLLGLVIVAVVLLRSFYQNANDPDAALPIVNRYPFEPRLFAKLRFAFNSREIFNKAYEKYKGQVYRVDRGDLELIVLPVEFIPELNTLPETVLSSRHAHSHNLLGHINGVEIVKTSSLYFRTILNKVTPALPSLTPSLKQRIGVDLEKLFPQSSTEWETLEPLDKIVHCISSAFSKITVPAPLCDEPEHIRLMSEQSRLVFEIVVLMRFVPRSLTPLLVWLMPSKWKLEANMKLLASFIVPEAQRLLAKKDISSEANLLSWMIQGAKTDVERDPAILTRLQAATAAGGTHSVGMFIDNALFDLIASPDVLEQVREEIRQKHKETGGVWDFAAYDSLFKLDSALKETARVGPPTMTVYNRLMMSDFRLSNGLLLRKGQMICMSGCSVQGDDSIFPEAASYQGLRAYNLSLQDNKVRPFKFADSELGWGSGRWACPGRFLATLEAKIILVKLLDEYDFKLLPGQGRPQRITFHDYGFIGEHEKLMVRRRTKTLGIGY